MPILRFENVTKQFDVDSYGVYEVTFSVEPGEFIFVTGPSGSGKTTLMRLLLKEYAYNSGEIFFHDAPLSSVRSNHVHLHRRKIGVVFQDYKLIPEMNIWENIALPLWVTGKPSQEVERRVTDLLNLIRLPEKAFHFPSQLSGGEAQRVGIARALAIGPEVVIADEPTGNLDPETALHVARLLKKINELGTTVIIATHDKNIIATYPETRKIALEKGKLVTDSHSKPPIHGYKRIESSAESSSNDSTTSQAATQKSVTQHSADKKTAQSQEKSPDDTRQGAHSDTQGAPANSSQQAAPAEQPLPWWKKILGGGKKSTVESSAETESNKDKETENSDDLVTITEEALDAEAAIDTDDSITTKYQITTKKSSVHSTKQSPAHALKHSKESKEPPVKKHTEPK
jgi:cell division transport system ATP-binding protein